MSDRGFQGWPDGARELVEKAVARHGGWTLWDRVERVEATLQELGGPLPFVKGLGSTHHVPRLLRIDPKSLTAVLVGQPSAGSNGVFRAGNVSIESDDGELVESSEHHRQTFDGWQKNRRWRELDALYFFGYAVVTYFSLPFLLAKTRFVRAELRGALDGVTVAFDPSFDTHSREQTFYFDSEGLLRRHDYIAEIVGNWARGAHFSDDYESVGGLMLAHTRRVFAAPFGRATFLPVLHANLGPFRLNPESADRSQIPRPRPSPNSP